jgi:hypothetical protein
MNERIKELAEQAGWYKADSLPSDWDAGDYIVSADEMKKFAELVVKECIKKCEFIADQAAMTNNGEIARKTCATAESCAVMIKEHFGITE